MCYYEYELTQLISFISASTLSLQKFRLFNANIEEDYNNNNLRGRRQLPGKGKKLGHDDLFDPPGKGKGKDPPAWGPGGNPDGTSEDHTLEPTSVDSLSDDGRRRQLKKGGNPAWKSWADSPGGNGGNPKSSPSLDVTVTSATSAASEESEDSEDVRRKLPGKGVEKSGNAWAQKGEKGPTSVDDSVTSGTSATSAASAESGDDRRKLSGSEPSISESEASESEESQASDASEASDSSLDEREVSEASTSSLDEERRKLPGNGKAPDWAGSKGGNPDGSPDDITVTNATSLASAESEASVDSSAE